MLHSFLTDYGLTTCYSDIADCESQVSGLVPIESTSQLFENRLRIPFQRLLDSPTERTTNVTTREIQSKLAKTRRGGANTGKPHRASISTAFLKTRIF